MYNEVALCSSDFNKLETALIKTLDLIKNNPAYGFFTIREVQKSAGLPYQVIDRYKVYYGNGIKISEKYIWNDYNIIDIQNILYIEVPNTSHTVKLPITESGLIKFD
jgi:hypothetical protein